MAAADAATPESQPKPAAGDCWGGFWAKASWFWSLGNGVGLDRRIAAPDLQPRECPQHSNHVGAFIGCGFSQAVLYSEC